MNPITTRDKTKLYAKLYVKDWGSGEVARCRSRHTGKSGRAAAKGISQSTLVDYDGAPHGPFATEKAGLAKDLLDFLGR